MLAKSTKRKKVLPWVKFKDTAQGDSNSRVGDVNTAVNLLCWIHPRPLHWWNWKGKGSQICSLEVKETCVAYWHLPNSTPTGRWAETGWWWWAEWEPWSQSERHRSCGRWTSWSRSDPGGTGALVCGSGPKKATDNGGWGWILRFPKYQQAENVSTGSLDRSDLFQHDGPYPLTLRTQPQSWKVESTKPKLSGLVYFMLERSLDDF